jgi:hypothetical protein
MISIGVTRRDAVADRGASRSNCWRGDMRASAPSRELVGSAHGSLQPRREPSQRCKISDAREIVFL